MRTPLEVAVRGGLWAAWQARGILGTRRVDAATSATWRRYFSFQLRVGAAFPQLTNRIQGRETSFVVIDPAALTWEGRGVREWERLADAPLPPNPRFLDLVPGNGVFADAVLRNVAGAQVTAWEPRPARAAPLRANLSIHEGRACVESDPSAFSHMRIAGSFDAIRMRVSDARGFIGGADVLRRASWIWVECDDATPGAMTLLALALQRCGFVVYDVTWPSRGGRVPALRAGSSGSTRLGALIGVNAARLADDGKGGAALEAARISFAQEGEDLILERFFPQTHGFYVDVGAHDPFRFSNTCAFHVRGWRGINVDASESAIRRFNEFRSHDINVWAGVGAEEGSLTFFEFNEPALSTFSAVRASELQAAGTGYHVVSRTTVPVLPLREILNRHLPDGQHIDFLSVDVEGLDLEVLRSNDWARFRPTAVVVEELPGPSAPAEGTAISRFLGSQGYSLRARTMNSVFFVDDRAGPGASYADAHSPGAHVLP